MSPPSCAPGTASTRHPSNPVPRPHRVTVDENATPRVDKVDPAVPIPDHSIHGDADSLQELPSTSRSQESQDNAFPPKASSSTPRPHVQSGASSSAVQQSLNRPRVEGDSASLMPESEHPNPAVPDSAAQGGAEGVRRRSGPFILHPIVRWGLVLVCLALTILVSLLYWLSHERRGLFTTHPPRNFRDNLVQLIYSSLPSFIMTAVTGIVLTPLAFNVWLLAPYTEPESEGELTDWINKSLWKRIMIAWRRRRPGLMSLGVATLLSTSLPVVASGLLETRAIIVSAFFLHFLVLSVHQIDLLSQSVQVDHRVPIQTIARLGIVNSTDALEGDSPDGYVFGTSEQYLQAASSATSQRPLPIPFAYSGVEGNWSITPLSLSMHDLPREGREFDSSILANLTVDAYGIESRANCRPANVTFPVVGSYTVIATLDGCSHDFEVPRNESFIRHHFANSTACNASRSDAAFKTFVYGLLSVADHMNNRPDRFIVMFCQPSINISRVSATMSFTVKNGIGALVKPPEIRESFPIGSHTTDPNVGNLLEAPLYGQALNGYDISLPSNTSNTSRAARVNITRDLMNEGIYGTMLAQMVGYDASVPERDWCTQLLFLIGMSDRTMFFLVDAGNNRQQAEQIISDFYQTHLSTFSRKVYFNFPGANNVSVTGTLSTLSTRIFISLPGAIALGALLALLSLFLIVTFRMQPMPVRGGDAVRLGISDMGTLVLTVAADLRVVEKLKQRQGGAPQSDDEPEPLFSMHKGMLVLHPPG